MMDRRAQTDVIFLDFATASDTVFHSSFMTELSAVNLSPNGLSWIHAFLTNRLQYSFVNNTFSNYCPVTSCSPQGSVVAPLFFSVFINHLPDCTSSSIHLFAVDCAIYRTIQTSSDALSLQHDVNTLSPWCSNWRLSRNTHKCCRVPFSRLLQPPHNAYHLPGTILASSLS